MEAMFFYARQKKSKRILNIWIKTQFHDIIVKILGLIEGMTNQCNSYKDDNFFKYSVVWSKSREAVIYEFVSKDRRKLGPDKQSNISVPLPPSLEQFEKQIYIYRDWQTKIRKFSDSQSSDCPELIFLH
jgi:hypothetical protein